MREAYISLAYISLMKANISQNVVLRVLFFRFVLVWKKKQNAVNTLKNKRDQDSRLNYV